MVTRAEAYYRREHRESPAVIETAEDVDRMIDYLLSGEEWHTAASVGSTDRPLLPSGSTDHEFLVGVSPQKVAGVITFGCGGQTLATLGAVDSGDELRYHIAGHDYYFPGNSEIPLDRVREAVKEFVFSGGQRPTCVDWQPFD